MFVEQIFFQMFLKCDTLIHSNIKLRCEQHCNATWIKLNSIQFNFKIGMQIGEKGIRILVNHHQWNNECFFSMSNS